MSNSDLSYQRKFRNGLFFIIIGALIPVVPFYMFISYYQSLGLPFACRYYGWFSDCGFFAVVWLVAESVGIVLITKGLLMRHKK